LAPDEKSNPLEDQPFSWMEVNGEVRISWQGRIVTILRKEKAVKFLERVQFADEEQEQLIMAKVTGNFKRGNERRPARKW
jgi:hypothetical protein